mmetsp:Transcript_96131/g.310051  ORF Transcript_96131/g.310051 Transcript_96131/m.310051 type:complete len:453 (+) Transcript_96131:1140-2498(+)
MIKSVLLAYTSNLAIPLTYIFNSRWMFVCSIFQGVMLGNARLTSLMYLLIFALDLYLFNMVEDAVSMSYRVRLPNYALSQGFIVVLALLVVWTLERVLMQEAQATVEVQQMTQAEAMVSQLLDAICDAVVKIDGPMRIISDSPKLAGLLLRRATGKGIDFLELLDEEDRPSFQAFLEKVVPAAAEVLAPTKHVRLVDSLGNRVRVQIFCTGMPVRGWDGRLKYVMGITADEEVHQESAGGKALRDEVACLQSDRSCRLERMDIMSESVWSGDSEFTTTVAVRLCAAISAKHIILQATPGFDVFVGRATAGVSFKQLLQRPKEFEQWLQAEKDDLEEGFNHRPHRSTFGPAVLLLPATGAKANTRRIYEAVFLVHFPLPPSKRGPEDDCKDEVFLPVFLDICWRKRLSVGQRVLTAGSGSSISCSNREGLVQGPLPVSVVPQEKTLGAAQASL